jgi:hypothetical protein
MVKKTKKKSMTKSNQFKLCRNKICADTRSIKINKKFKRPNHIYRKLYYFLDTSKKKYIWWKKIHMKH